MQEIPDTTIEKSWNEISSDPEKCVEKFHEDESVVADFLSEAFRDFGSEALDLGFFVALVVWRAIDLTGRKTTIISSDMMTEEYRSALAWVEKFGKGEDSILLEKKIRDHASYSQPHLMRFVLDAVLDCHEDGLDLSPEEQERLLVCLKAVVDAYSRLV